MKKTTITEKVNSGLFKQKQSKVMSPAKKDKDPGMSGTYYENRTKGAGSRILQKGAEKMKTVNTDDYDGAQGYQDVGEWKKFLKTPKGKAYKENNTKKVGTGEFEKDTYKDVPGKDIVTKEFKNTRTRDTNSAMSPWEVRQQSRSIKKSNRDVRRSGNKLDKIKRDQAELEADGITSGKKFDKLKRKFTENTNELDAFEKNSKARSRQSEVSASASNNDKFQSSGRDKKFADEGDGGRKRIKDGDYEGANKKKPVDFAEIAGDLDVKDPSAVASKATNTFFKGKTPLKKKYFK